VERVFDGAAQPLVLSLVRDRKLSRRQLEEISRLIAETPEDRP
jgi:predicted transcriptional regulator